MYHTYMQGKQTPLLNSMCLMRQSAEHPWIKLYLDVLEHHIDAQGLIVSLLVRHVGSHMHALVRNKSWIDRVWQPVRRLLSDSICTDEAACLCSCLHHTYTVSIPQLFDSTLQPRRDAPTCFANIRNVSCLHVKTGCDTQKVHDTENFEFSRCSILHT